jgi:hypothetical protein
MVLRGVAGQARSQKGKMLKGCPRGEPQNGQTLKHPALQYERSEFIQDPPRGAKLSDEASGSVTDLPRPSEHPLSLLFQPLP